MNHLFIRGTCLAAACVFISSCASAPSATARDDKSFDGSARVVTYSGGTDGSPGSSEAEKAASPSIHRLKSSEAVAQATIHEADMDEAIASGDFRAALASYREASSLLSPLSGSAAANKLAAIRAKVSSALGLIAFETVSAPKATTASVAFKTPFTVSVSVATAQGPKKAAAFPCVVSYPSVNEAGEPIVISEAKSTDAAGLLSFSAPVPASAGKGFVVFAPDVGSGDEFLRKELADRNARGELSLRIPHLVTTSAKRVPTTISILDFTPQGKAIVSANASATALLKPLVQHGFSRIGMADFPNQLASGDETALIKAARAQFGGGVQRFIYGTTRVESLERDADGLWSCSLAVSVSVWDFVKDAKTLESSFTHVAKGKTEALAVDAARREAASDLLVDELIYRL